MRILSFTLWTTCKKVNTLKKEKKKKNKTVSNWESKEKFKIY